MQDVTLPSSVVRVLWLTAQNFHATLAEVVEQNTQIGLD